MSPTYHPSPPHASLKPKPILGPLSQERSIPTVKLPHRPNLIYLLALPSQISTVYSQQTTNQNRPKPRRQHSTRPPKTTTHSTRATSNHHLTHHNTPPPRPPSTNNPHHPSFSSFSPCISRTSPYVSRRASPNVTLLSCIECFCFGFCFWHHHQNQKTRPKTNMNTSHRGVLHLKLPVPASARTPLLHFQPAIKTTRTVARLTLPKRQHADLPAFHYLGYPSATEHFAASICMHAIFESSRTSRLLNG